MRVQYHRSGDLDSVCRSMKRRSIVVANPSEYVDRANGDVEFEESPGLSVEGLCAKYGATTILRGVDLEVLPGRISLVIGRNGCGKSTLLKVLFGVPGPNMSGGRIAWNGSVLNHIPCDKAIKLGIRYIPQRGGIFLRLSVLENLRLASHASPMHREGAVERALTVFPSLRTLLTKRAGALSGGQQRLVSFAMGLTTNPRLILVDEPSAGLSPKLAATVFENLDQIRTTASCAILLVEQNVAAALPIAQDICLIRDGVVHWRGSRSELLATPDLAAFL